MTKLLFALAAPCILAAMPAQADTPTGVVYAGGTISDSASAHAGAVVSLPGGSLGHGLAARAGVGGGRYHYDAGGTEITADYASAEIGLVQQVSGRWGWANFSAGPRFTHTRLSPVDPANSRRGSRWDLGLQTDGALDSSRWRLRWLGAYGVVDEAYQARLQLGRKFGDKGLQLGLEGGVQGDPSYRKLSGGAFVATSLGRGFEAQAGGGVSKERAQTARGYASLALAKVF